MQATTPCQVPGGVARNIAHTMAALQPSAARRLLLLSAVGHDAAAELLLRSLEEVGLPSRGVRRCEGLRTATVAAVFSPEGEIAACVADCDTITTAVDAAFLAAFRADIAGAALVILDANLSPEAMAAAAAAAGSRPLWFEPVSAPKAARVVALLAPGRASLAYASPNAGELVAMASALRGGGRGGGPARAESAFRTADDALVALEADIRTVLHAGVERVVLKLGPLGVLLCSAGRRLHLPAPAAAVVCTSGAGDSLVAGAATALLGGAAPEAAVAFGMAVARQVVQSAENAPKAGWDVGRLQATASIIAAAGRELGTEKVGGGERSSGATSAGHDGR